MKKLIMWNGVKQFFVSFLFQAQVVFVYDDFVIRIRVVDRKLL
jgi:hypothetical protein